MLFGTYGWLRDYILQLIHRYSVAGELVATTYNNQQDYINKIPSLVNDALIYIATTSRRIPAQTLLDPADAEVFGRWKRFTLPEDLLKVRGGGLVFVNGRSPRAVFKSYLLQLPDYILVDRTLDEPVALEYYRRPELLPEEPADNYRIDADPDVLMAIAFYAAAHLVLQDDSFAYASLYNEFENKLSRLAQTPPDVEVGAVVDVYGTDMWGDGDV